MSQKGSERKWTMSFGYYPTVWWAVVRKSLSKTMTYRFEFISKGFRAILLIAIQVILIESIFSGSEYISGWSVDEYYLLVGIYNIVNYMGWGIFNVNLWRIEEKVLKGEFDHILLLPTGSIFSASFMEFFLDDMIASLAGFIMVGYYILIHWSDITLIGVIGGVICIICAFIVWFALNLTVAAMNFVSVKNGLQEFLKGVSKVGSFPVDIFSQGVKLLLFTIFPIAFIAAVPSRVISGAYTWEFILFSVIASIATLLITRQIWEFSIRHYSSAGG